MDLPEPLVPMTATTSPGRIVRSTPRRIGRRSRVTFPPVMEKAVSPEVFAPVVLAPVVLAAVVFAPVVFPAVSLMVMLRIPGPCAGW
ncbi:hypothetical protein GCM10010149_62120 [Nonomuraea roseoviolacea subsp. roseoviolacea]